MTFWYVYGAMSGMVWWDLLSVCKQRHGRLAWYDPVFFTIFAALWPVIVARRIAIWFWDDMP